MLTVGTSKAEEELISYIKSILPENYHVEENYRGLISPYEVDVYILNSLLPLNLMDFIGIVKK